MFEQRTRVGVVQTPHLINTAQIENIPPKLAPPTHQTSRTCLTNAPEWVWYNPLMLASKLRQKTDFQDMLYSSLVDMPTLYVWNFETLYIIKY